jgi:hypothetical protein
MKGRMSAIQSIQYGHLLYLRQNAGISKTMMV